MLIPFFFHCSTGFDPPPVVTALKLAVSLEQIFILLTEIIIVGLIIAVLMLILLLKTTDGIAQVSVLVSSQVTSSVSVNVISE